MNIDKRPTFADLNQVESWLKEEFSKNSEGFYNNFKSFRKNHGENIVTVKNGNHVMGFLTYTADRFLCEINIFSIKPGFRGQGIGRVLFDNFYKKQIS